MKVERFKLKSTSIQLTDETPINQMCEIDQSEYLTLIQEKLKISKAGKVDPMDPVYLQS